MGQIFFTLIFVLALVYLLEALLGRERGGIGNGPQARIRTRDGRSATALYVGALTCNQLFVCQKINTTEKDLNSDREC